MKDYQITLTGEEVTLVMNMLSQAPYYQVSDILKKLEEQVKEQ